MANDGPRGVWRRLGERLWYNPVWGRWSSSRFFVIFGLALFSAGLGAFWIVDSLGLRGEAVTPIWFSGGLFFSLCLVSDVVISTRKAKRRTIENEKDVSVSR